MRNSDRWITPGVIIVGLLGATVCILATIAAVAWLTARGMDPQPMLQLVAVAVAALGSVGSFVVQLTNRRTTTKVERNTGNLANAVADVVDTITPPVRAAAPPPVPPTEIRHRRHGYPDTGATPVRGS
jgi:hypothetical protein